MNFYNLSIKLNKIKEKIDVHIYQIIFIFGLFILLNFLPYEYNPVKKYGPSELEWIKWCLLTLFLYVMYLFRSIKKLCSTINEAINEYNVDKNEKSGEVIKEC